MELQNIVRVIIKIQIILGKLVILSMIIVIILAILVLKIKTILTIKVLIIKNTNNKDINYENNIKDKNKNLKRFYTAK